MISRPFEALTSISLKVALVGSLAIASIGSAAAQDLYLIIGQSNAAGRDSAIDSNGADSGTRDVQLFTESNTFVSAEQPLNQYSGVRKSAATQGVNFGLEFGKNMHDSNGRTVYLVVNARGGTKIPQWREGNSAGYFDNTVQRVKDAEGACGCRLKGILWHQGESNVSSGNGTFTSTYFNSLAGLINEYRDELRDVPFLAGQLFNTSYNKSFNDELKTLDDGNFLYDVDWVTSRKLTTTDGTHFDAASTRKLGERYAKVMRDYVN